MFTTKVSVVKCADLPGNPSFIGGKFVRMDEDLVKIKAAVKEAVEKGEISVQRYINYLNIMHGEELKIEKWEDK